MIDPENLRTASLYINNQLLSRGLLRDGQNIDFANPEHGDGGLEATMGRIMSVVNDLILRRDRDAEHRESLSSTLRMLRADTQRQTTEFARQTERLSDAQRRLDIAEATERSLRTQLKSAEQGIHKLREESAKMKSLVAQTRSACANEVRKRDRQIDTLKKAVADAGRVRGGGKSRDIITITVTGEYDGEGRDIGMPVGATESEGYSLRMETNGFLAELAKGLSEENEGLLVLVRRTATALREMSGLDRTTDPANNQSRNSHAHDELVVQSPQKTADELASELEAVVEHLRSILTNPSFVPIEEVEVRDELINRLRSGLETMEARWKDAVHMMDGWRRRMVSSGKAVDMEDLQMGMRLSPVRVRNVEETANVERMRLSYIQEEEEEEEEEDEEDEEEEAEEEVNKYQQRRVEEPEPRGLRPRSPGESLRLVPAPGYEAGDLGEDSDSDSSLFQDDIDMDDLDVEEPNVQILQISTADSIDSSPLPEPPQLSPLKDSYSSGNRGTSRDQPSRKRREDVTTIAEENTRDLAQADSKERPASPPRVSKPISPTPRKVTPEFDEDGLPNYTASYDSPLFGRSGEKPSQEQLNRKLFSKPSVQVSEQQPSNTGASTSSARSQGAKGSPPRTRTTRSSARKSPEPSPTSSRIATRSMKRAAIDSDIHVASPTATTATTTAAAATSPQKKAPEAVPRSVPARSSPSPPTSPRNTQLPLRSPTSRTQPTSSSSSASRLPRAHIQQSPLNMATIAAKLAASEREADAARVRAKLKAVRRSRRISGMMEEAAASPRQAQTNTRPETKQSEARAPTDVKTADAAQSEQSAQSHHEQEDVDPVKRDPGRSPMKKGPRRRWSRGLAGADEVDELALGPEITAGAEKSPRKPDAEDMVDLKITKRRNTRHTSKFASRRRSTLSPWELQGLITGNVESPGR